MRLQRVPVFVLPVHCVAVVLELDVSGSVFKGWIVSAGFRVEFEAVGLHTEHAVKPLSNATCKVISFFEYLR